jgi:hypothetical protein
MQLNLWRVPFLDWSFRSKKRFTSKRVQPQKVQGEFVAKRGDGAAIALPRQNQRAQKKEGGFSGLSGG